MRNLFLSNRFFQYFGAVILIMATGFILPILLPIGQTLLVLGLIISLLDFLLLFNKNTSIKLKRLPPKVFSLGDANEVRIEIKNDSGQDFEIEIIDELPEQFQKRDFAQRLSLEKGANSTLIYELTPRERGEYTFGDLHAFITGKIGMVQRRITEKASDTLAVYPSIIQMKQFEIKAFERVAVEVGGVKKIRRIGHSYEFEQIKEYVRGDDYRSINWKATSRRGALMVNQYEDERAQQVYCFIDKSRVMKMPFKGLSLMDYAINASLVISNIVLKKYDRAGLMTFSDRVGATIKAERKANQLNKILQVLYNEKERPVEANYELLYRASRSLILGRSLIFLFTNFESTYAMERVLPILRRISKIHLLVVVFFENTEVKTFSEKRADSLEEIYFKTIAQETVAEKEQMVQKLRQYGIQAILTSPDELSLNTVNKYLELKSRGLI